ncbi:type IV pili methyl-accepting chemotaxis transducer N-terminal domain-containing protein [Diaphorobacter caeni]|uniref:type IV pili methyl-accepting chemotaxis transducer N-terminal domain-containing protein n=1 Tax=Diaphorobacter caeni TaxID=2784387 RepID=UPI00188E1282|nr:type IV pili methyl-accepting chemotaxis transducer N-terminal domain-containing protein [Diaphorobacter caeni]MBF5002764.1 type IV pili methyl-accepting chemotaxis transducer N-terminal domain-containing protein [Diaphorobacter caeni]
MNNRPSLSTKLQVLGVAFLLVALASIGFTLWITWRLEGGAAAVNEAGRLRMNMMRMVLAHQHETPEALAQRMLHFDESLELLRAGDPSRPLFVPWNDEARTHYALVQGAWSALKGDWQKPAPVDEVQSLERADRFVASVDMFVESIETQIARLTAALHLFQLFMVALAIGSAVAFIALSYLLVLNPVSRLQDALSRVRKGDLATRIEVDSTDEFGQLNAGFNLMTHALQSSHEDLEQKVREKTASINVQNQRLAALYAVSALAAEAGDLHTLTRGFIQEIKKVAACDAAVVRWSDETNERYMMLASDGMPEAVQDEEQCLMAGSCECGQSLDGEPAAMRVISLVPKGSHDKGLSHCLQAGFRTVVSIPVQLQQRVLGEVDLFFRTHEELSDGMRDLLTTMAHHLANSMESMRVTALEREAAVAQERSLIARELHDSIAQSLAFLKIQTHLLRDAVARKDEGARNRTMDELEIGVQECYNDVRELLIHFRTRTQDEDIEDALRSTLSKFEHQTGVATTLAMHGHGYPLAPDVQIQVLHIVQEALSNVRKHAGATRVDLLVQRHPFWRFEVLDNGCGFVLADVPPDSLHVGLGIMKERAERISARLEVRAREPGPGTSVVVQLPLAAGQLAPGKSGRAKNLVSLDSP